MQVVTSSRSSESTPSGSSWLADLFGADISVEEIDEMIRKSEAQKMLSRVVPPKPSELPATKRRGKTIARGRKMSRARRQVSGEIVQSGIYWKGRHRIDRPDGSREKSQLRTIGLVGSMTKAEAQDLYFQEYLLKANVDAKNPSSMTTLRDFVDTVFETRHLPKLAPKTAKSYRDDLRNHVLPMLGDLPMRDISRFRIQALLTEMQKKGLRRPSRLNVRALLSKLFTLAIQTGFHQGEKPTEFLDVGPKEPSQQLFLSPDNFVRLLDEIKHKETRLLCLLAAGTSMNIAEMVGLPLKFVNLTDKSRMVATVFDKIFPQLLPPKSIFVHQQWTLGQVGPVKKNARNRILPLSDELVKALLAHVTRERFTDPEDFVFVSRVGTPVDEHNLAKRHLKLAASRAKVPWVSWHDFRRLHATAMKAVGISSEDRIAAMGHTEMKMTLHYTGDAVEARRPGVEKVREWISGGA